MNKNIELNDSETNTTENSLARGYISKLVFNNGKELDINNMQDLVMTIFAMLKGDSLRSFYRVKLFDDYVTNWEYSIPNMKFVRRKS